jgi:hypothetical protein
MPLLFLPLFSVKENLAKLSSVECGQILISVTTNQQNFYAELI